MVSTEGQVKLLDLGLTRLQSTDDQSADHTATGQAIGTADYVAPEQIKDGRNVDYRADLYGLGCTMFKMLTGVAPFSSPKYDTAFSKMNAHVLETPPNVSSLRPEVPAALNTLIQQLLEKSPAKRPQSAAGVEETFNAFGSEECLQSLVEEAMKLSPLENELKPQPLASGEPTKPWLSRSVPFWAAIAAGLGGVAIGMLLGITLTINKPDGTTAKITIPDGSTAQVDAEGNVALQLEDDSEQKMAIDDQKPSELIPLLSEADASDRKFLQGVWRTFLHVELGPLKDSPPRKSFLFIGDNTTSIRDQEFDDERLTVGEYNLLFDPKTEKRVIEAMADKSRNQFAPYQFIDDDHLIIDIKDNKSQGACYINAERVITPQTPGEAVLLHANKTLQNADGRIVFAIAKPKKGVSRTKPDLTIDDLDVDPVQRITQRDFASASVTTDSNGRPVLSFEMRKVSGKKLFNITKNNIGQLLAVFIDGKLNSAPRINAAISDMGQLSGSFSKEELVPIAAAINDYGAEIKSHIIASKRLLKISEAILKFENANQYLPSSKNMTHDGKPCKPYSWRVAILPYIGQQELFDRYHFEKEWDSEENSKLLWKMPELFRGKIAAEFSTTGYLGIADEHATFGDGNKKLADFTDGTSPTIAILQTDHGVPWTKPEDLKLSDELINECLQKNFPFSTVDGAIHSIPRSKLDKKELKNLITIDDGNPVNILSND